MFWAIYTKKIFIENSNAITCFFLMMCVCVCVCTFAIIEFYPIRLKILLQALEGILSVNPCLCK